MAAFTDSLANLIDRILRMLGLKKSDADKTAALIDGWKLKRRSLNDQIDSLKSDIRDIEGVLRAKKQELDSTPGESREIVEQEIKSAMDELDQKKRKQDIIFGAVGRLTTLVARAEEMHTAQGTQISIEAVEELEVQFSSVLADLRDADREVGRVGQMGYKRPVAEPKDYAKRMAALSEPAAATTAPAETAAPRKEASSTLSEEERKRLDRITENTN